MEDDHSFHIFLFLPWKKIFSVKISFIFHGRRASFLHFFISSMEDGRFFSVQPLSTMVEAPRPFDFLVSRGAAQLAFYAFVISSISHMFIICCIPYYAEKVDFQKMKAHFDVFLLYACEFIRP